jgi:predicted nucleic acid-binding protein
LSGLLFDTSLYIESRRSRRASLLDPHDYPAQPIYLSTVVGHELYVGAADRRERRFVDRLWARFERTGRLLVPSATDWINAGLVIQEIGAQPGYETVGRARLTNDALLAMSARRLGMTVLTLNARDFSLLASNRPFRWAVAQDLT